MGLRCTVFGHRWGEPEMERDREEDGDEVVVTVREVRTCRRCGTEDVLGESMEVTAIEPRDADPPDGTTRQAGADEDDCEAVEYDAGTDDGVILDEDGGPDDERGPREWPDRPERDGDPEATGEPTPWPEPQEDPDPAEERFVGADRAGDGERRERDDGRPPREHDAGERDGATEGVADATDAEAPADATDADAGDGPTDAAGDRPTDDEAERDDEGSAAGDTTPPRIDDDAEVLEATETNEQSRITAEEPVDPPAGDAEASSPDTGGQFDRDDRSREPGDQPRVADDGADGDDGSGGVDLSAVDDEPPEPEDVEYYCPECGYVDDSEWPSRRAGDVCPDCGGTYLAERRR